MDKPKTLYIIVIGILSFFIIIGTMLLFNKDSPNRTTDIDLSGTDLIVQISYGEDNYDVHKDITQKTDYILKNGECIDIAVAPNHNHKTIMKLPPVGASADFDKDIKAATNTYKLDIVQSLGYVNKLKSDGYNVEFEALTPNFYELYMKTSEMPNYRRLIITDTYLIEFNVNAINFNIEDYLF